MSVSKTLVLERLRKVKGPDLESNIVDLGLVSEILIRDNRVYFSITVPAARANELEALRQAAEKMVAEIEGVSGVTAVLTAEAPKRNGAAAPAPSGNVATIAEHKRVKEARERGMAGDGADAQHRSAMARGPAPAFPPQSAPAKSNKVQGVKHLVAVASGKGGVGKSTTALNLALALRDLGMRVGLLDADIYGPSVPRLIGLNEKPSLNDAKKMIPIMRFGMPMMSIGFLVAEETAMVWRGPMVMSAIRQMLWDVVWGELDVLVVDMPPGTGDAQLTLAQQVPLRGAVIVSTPQDLALIDARRGISMFAKVDVPTLGIIENMSYFECPECGTRSDIFGHGGARHEAERLKVPFLGEIPLHMSIRTSSDAGTPVVESDPKGPHAAIYRAIGEQIKQQLERAPAKV